MRRSAWAFVAIPLVLTACAGSTPGASDAPSVPPSVNAIVPAPATTVAGEVSGKVGVILPDRSSSARWETADRRYLGDAFTAAGVPFEIANADGDKAKMASIADQMVAGGVTVLMLVNLDSPSAAAIEQKVAGAGVKTIDYDRLTLGGSASVYVSFDGVQVGVLQGQGLVKCLTERGVTQANVVELNGSPTDNNATLFKQGYDSILHAKYDAGAYVEIDDQSVPEWSKQLGGQMFEQMLAKANGDIDGVLAANDGLGNAAIEVLRRNHKQVPVTGQDATVQGLQNILAGDQCMTVYKAVEKEADAAADAAIALLRGGEPQTTGTVTDRQSGRQVPAVLATPVAIFRDDIKDVVADGYVSVAELCAGVFADSCTRAGIS